MFFVSFTHNIISVVDCHEEVLCAARYRVRSLIVFLSCCSLSIFASAAFCPNVQLYTDIVVRCNDAQSNKWVVYIFP